MGRLSYAEDSTSADVGRLEDEGSVVLELFLVEGGLVEEAEGPTAMSSSVLGLDVCSELCIVVCYESEMREVVLSN